MVECKNKIQDTLVYQKTRVGVCIKKFVSQRDKMSNAANCKQIDIMVPIESISYQDPSHKNNVLQVKNSGGRSRDPRQQF